MAEPDIFWLTAKEILDCVCTSLEEDSPCGCPCRACVVAGTPVWDNCCEDGQLTIYLERIFVAGNFPSQASGPVFCSSPLAADFVVQLLRCAPTVKDDGTPPTCEELSENAREIMTDMFITERAVICCLAAEKRNRLFTMRDARVIGPQGGCVGIEIRFSVEIRT